MSKKIIAVVGATGAQGGGLVRSILADAGGELSVRAISRDAKSAKARELEKLGASVVAASVDDPESLRRAFRGAHGAFCVTFFWEHFSPVKERAHAAAMAAAAKAEGVAHVVWSTLEDTRHWVPVDDPRMPTLHGNYKVPHFDAKGESDRFFAEAAPTTFLLTSFYWDNLITFGMGPKKRPDGKLSFVLPMGDRKLPGIAAEDIGRCAHGIFRRGHELVGKTVGIAGEHLTGAAMAAALGKALGKDVVHDAVPPDAYRKFGFPGAEDLGNMFQFNHDFEQVFCGARDLAFSRALNPSLQTFPQWVERNKTRIPIG